MPRIIDVIEVPDQAGHQIVRRVPEIGSGDIRLGSQLIVRETQQAVFFRDGQALDVFGPGRYTLTTANIPLLAGLIGLATAQAEDAEAYLQRIRFLFLGAAALGAVGVLWFSWRRGGKAECWVAAALSWGARERTAALRTVLCVM